MQVIDLTEEYKDLYFVCLEDRSDEIKEAGNHKQHRKRGLGKALLEAAERDAKLDQAKNKSGETAEKIKKKI